MEAFLPNPIISKAIEMMKKGRKNQSQFNSTN